jgi:hypothetical protein
MGGLFSAPFGEGGFAEQAVPLWFQANFAKQRQKPDEDRIFSAFGRFIASYALAEAGVHIAARFFSGMPDKKARIMFKDMRIVDVSDRLIQLAPKESGVEEVASQLTLISGARNQFVHRLIEYKHGEGLSVTNRLTSKAASEAEPRIFSLAELEHMEIDCRVIFGRFLLICDQPSNLGVHVDISLMGLFGPWRYKPPQPEKTAQPILDDRARRKRLRRAWRASQSPPDPAK